MARTSRGQMRSSALIVVAVAGVLLVAVAVLLWRSPPPAPGIDEATAERIATDFVARGEASDTQIFAVVVDRYEDHDTFWRVILHADLAVRTTVGDPPVRSMLPITYHYQVDVDKQTATPTMHDQS